MRRLRGFIKCRSGTTAVEFAFIGMLLFTSTIGIVEVGRALFLLNELAYAADRASRLIMLQFDITEADLAALVRDEDLLPGLVADNVSVTSPPQPATAAFRTVTLSYALTPMVSGLTISPVTLTAARQVAK